MIKLFLVCLVGIAAVQALDNEGGNNLRSKARELGFEQCLGKCVLNLFQSKECIECIRETDAFIIGDAQLPAGAIADLLQAKLGTGYTEMWCGEEDLPLGWRKEGNKYTGCEKTVDFPGNDATSHQLHSYVKSEMAKMPKLQYEGKIWRGNELGFIISNEKFTNEEIKPRSILLGSTVDQHIIIRPILDSFFGKCEGECLNMVKDEVNKVLSQETLAVQKDLKVMVHKILMKTIFGYSFTAIPWDINEFIDTQTSYTTLSTLTQMVTDSVGNVIETFTKTKEKLNNYYHQLKVLVEQYPERFAVDFDTADCGETLNNGKKDRNCVSQVANAMLDTLLAAGGLSVPGALSTGLFVLYGDLESANSNNKFSGIFPAGASDSLNDNNAKEFYYESMRFFAPVVGLPQWTKFPARAFDDSASQVAGGTRKILNLALANKDPNAWGSDAHQFRVRTMSEYHELFVGFADFAKNDNVAGGKMNRVCPGKGLAVAIGETFFTVFKKSQWHTRDVSEYAEATPFMDEFVLYPKSNVCPYTCSALDAKCHAQELHCKLCDIECAQKMTCNQRCSEDCSYSCRWWDAGCHWRKSLCNGRKASCYTACTFDWAPCVVC